MATAKTRRAKQVQAPARAAKKAVGSARAAQARKSAQPTKQPRARSRPPEADPESAVAAVERALAEVTITPKKAVAAATVRRLAAALDKAEPGDVSKVSRELDARMAVLLAEVEPDAADKDWTEGTGSSEVRDPAKPGSANPGRGDRRRRSSAGSADDAAPAAHGGRARRVQP